MNKKCNFLRKFTCQTKGVTALEYGLIAILMTSFIIFSYHETLIETLKTKYAELNETILALDPKESKGDEEQDSPTVETEEGLNSGETVESEKDKGDEEIVNTPEDIEDIDDALPPLDVTDDEAKEIISKQCEKLPFWERTKCHGKKFLQWLEDKWHYLTGKK